MTFKHRRWRYSDFLWLHGVWSIRARSVASSPAGGGSFLGMGWDASFGSDYTDITGAEPAFCSFSAESSAPASDAEDTQISLCEILITGQRAGECTASGRGRPRSRRWD